MFKQVLKSKHSIISLVNWQNYDNNLKSTSFEVALVKDNIFFRRLTQASIVVL